MAQVFFMLTLLGSFLNIQLPDFFNQLFSRVNQQVTQQGLPAQTICVDAGHGGEDSGALYNDLVEEEVTLDIANRLKALLEQNGYRVVMTRMDHATALTNSQRAQICNDRRANLLVSIHLNYNDDTTLDYTQGLYGTAQKDEKFTEFIHQTLASQMNLGDGEITDFENNMLLKAQMPATLQETVFLSSNEEYKLLSDGTGRRQQQIAQALYTGINNWYLGNN